MHSLSSLPDKSLMNRALVFGLIVVSFGQAHASEQTEVAFTSIVFNYWCQEGSPPKNSRELSRVIDLAELDAYLDFNPDEWLSSVRFEKQGDTQKIIGPEKSNVTGVATSIDHWSSTHVCGDTES